MNKIVLVGRLTKDPESKVIELSGSSCTRFTLAVKRKYKNKDGERDTDFISMVAWNKTAEIISKYLRKGSQVCVSGRLHTDNYVDKQGIKKYVTEVYVDDFQFLDSNRNIASGI